MARIISWIVGFLLICVLAALFLPAIQRAREGAHYKTEVRSATDALAMGSAVNGTYRGEATELARNKSAGEVVPPYAINKPVFLAAHDVAGGAVGDAKPAGADRKIIYSANIDVVVEDFAGVPEKVAELVKKFDGYVARSNLSGSAGETRRGTWKVRVPVARFDEFVAAAKGLGELVSAGTSSRDVSEEYYDVDARIRNKTKEEERLLKLLEERPGKLEDVIAIERELSRVREELERMQGRMRVLSDLTSLTTADLTITEIHNYKPEDAPNLKTRVHRSFADSLEGLQATAADTVVVGAAVVPWLPLVALVVGVVYVADRKLRRSRVPAAQKQGNA